MNPFSSFFSFSSFLVYLFTLFAGGAIVEVFDDVTFTSPEIKTAFMSHEYSLENTSEIR